MRKCYVRHASTDDVAIHLRDEQTRDTLVLPPAGEPPWVGVVASDAATLDDVARRLATRFGLALLVCATDAGWSLHVVQPEGETFHLSSDGIDKDNARKAAQSVSRALGTPRITTALTRALSRPLSGKAALDKVGGALDLVACDQTFQEIVDNPRQPQLRVDGSKVTGKLPGMAAGPGYTHVSALIEDLVVPLLDKERYEAVILLLRGYDVNLSAEDGAMRCRAPQGLVTPGLLAAITAHKDALLRHL